LEACRGEDPDAYQILKLRAEILELGSAIRQLQRAGLDHAAAQLLIARKRAQLDLLVKTNSASPALTSLTSDAAKAVAQRDMPERVNAGCRNGRPAAGGAR
jgi:hypothetical protein